MGKQYRRALLLGTFDLWHRGHTLLCKRASLIASEVVVGLNSDDFAQSYKRRPVERLSTRLMRASNCKYVTFALVNAGGSDSKPCIEVSNCDLLVHGDDWTGPEYLKQLDVTQDWLDERGISLVYMPYTEGVSTTVLLKERSIA